jgi:L-lactate dehydrogenase complex protein LldG
MDRSSDRAAARAQVVSPDVGGASEEPAVSRDAVIAAIRTARHAGVPGLAREQAPQAYQAAADGAPPVPEPPGADRAAVLFVRRAREVGMRVEIVASVNEAAERVTGLCIERAARRVALWATPEVAAVSQRLRGAGIQTLGPGAALADVAQADLGVTGAEWGIAETATLVLPAGPDRPRLTSLLPPVHVAVLHAERILPDLRALFGRVGTLPPALTLITGPSRSADIGLVPVVGAHGPTEVIVVLVTQ